MMINVSNARKLDTWHTIALTSDALTVTIMDMLQQIALTKSHLLAHQQDAGTTTLVNMTDQHLRVITTPGITTMTIGIGTGSADLDLIPITLGIGSLSTYHYCRDTTHHRSSSCRNFSRDDSRSRTCQSSKHHYKTPQRTILQFTSNTLEAQR